jgi:hypothetical protein
MNIQNLEDGSVLYSDGKGAMQVHDFGHGVALHVRRGIIALSFAEHVIADGERHLKRAGRYVLMVDGLETKLHTTDFRESMTAWFREHDKAVVHMLIRSKMLEMALNVANLSLGERRAQVYFDMHVWEAVGRRESPEFGRRPLALLAV